MKNGFKNLVYFFLNKLLLGRGKSFASILMYHSIGDNDAFFTVSPKNFERQIKYLKENDYQTLFLADLVERIKNGTDLGPKSIVLTFDDGYEDNYLNAFPVLKKHSFKATIFLATGFIGKELGSKNNPPLKMLNWEQIAKMQDSGLVDFQLHTVNHVDLTSVSADETEKEILGAKNLLETKLNKRCNFFAYPWGKYNRETISILKNHGFKSAVTVKEGIVKGGDNPFELKRNSIDSVTTKEQFIGKTNYSVEIFRKIFGQKTTHS